MSLAVQPTTDLKILSGAAQAEKAEIPGDSGGFSDVIEELATDCTEECSTESGNPDGQAHSERGGTANPNSGKGGHADGENLPHEPAFSESGLVEPENLEELRGTPQDSVSTIVEANQNRINQEAGESVYPADVIDQIYNGTQPEANQKPSVKEGPNVAENPLKPNVEFGSDMFARTAAETGEDVTVTDSAAELLAATRRGADPLMPATPIEAERRRVDPGTIKENINLGTSSGLTGVASKLESGLTPDSQARSQNGITFPTEQVTETQARDIDTFELKQNLQKLGRSSDAAEMPRKADMEALLKDWVPSTSKEASLNSTLSTGTQANPATGLANSLGLSQNSTLPGQASSLSGSTQLLSLSTPVSDQAWADDFAVRIRTLVSGNVQQATLNLRPAELGAIEVSLSTDGNDTKAQFVVQNAAVREVLESSMPRLREIFQDSGLSLTDTDVRDQSQSQQAEQQGGGDDRNTYSNRLDNRNLDSGESDSADANVEIVRWDGDQMVSGVDTFI